MNKNIKNVVVRDYHGSKTAWIDFELNGKAYYAVQQWDSEGATTRCEYGRTLPVEYYDTLETLEGADMRGMNNKAVECIFGQISEVYFDELRKIKN